MEKFLCLNIKLNNFNSEFMRKELPNWENLTEDSSDAAFRWRHIYSQIQKCNKTEILENPIILDLGGGMGEFSKNLNAQGINCISLDIKDLETNPGAKQVRGSAYNLPFADGSISIVHGCGVFDSSFYHHDFPKLLAEIARILKPGGVLSVFDPEAPPKEELEKYFKLLEGEVSGTELWEKI